MAAGTTRYRPSGPAFHDVASLDFDVDRAGHIDRMTLQLDRSFIEDARNGAFAGDIAASFIENLAGSGDRGSVGGFLGALQRDALDRPTVIFRAGTLPEPSVLDEAEQPLRVYRGSGDGYEFVLSEIVISLQNIETDGTRLLRIVAARRG